MSESRLQLEIGLGDREDEKEYQLASIFGFDFCSVC
jgi:hypothetical protein